MSITLNLINIGSLTSVVKAKIEQKHLAWHCFLNPDAFIGFFVSAQSEPRPSQ